MPWQQVFHTRAEESAAEAARTPDRFAVLVVFGRAVVSVGSVSQPQAVSPIQVSLSRDPIPVVFRWEPKASPVRSALFSSGEPGQSSQPPFYA